MKIFRAGLMAAYPIFSPMAQSNGTLCKNYIQNVNVSCLDNLNDLQQQAKIDWQFIVAVSKEQLARDDKSTLISAKLHHYMTCQRFENAFFYGMTIDDKPILKDIFSEKYFRNFMRSISPKLQFQNIEDSITVLDQWFQKDYDSKYFSRYRMANLPREELKNYSLLYDIAFHIFNIIKHCPEVHIVLWNRVLKVLKILRTILGYDLYWQRIVEISILDLNRANKSVYREEKITALKNDIQELVDAHGSETTIKIFTAIVNFAFFKKNDVIVTKNHGIALPIAVILFGKDGVQFFEKGGGKFSSLFNFRSPEKICWNAIARICMQNQVARKFHDVYIVCNVLAFMREHIFQHIDPESIIAQQIDNLIAELCTFSEI
ncbi:MAG: hypothetical protein LBB11_01330 [Puniceicoccales bacterium]|nr:hypothetical protein [Puniceicoccales bacterium]